jgi:hypothetical protein
MYTYIYVYMCLYVYTFNPNLICKFMALGKGKNTSTPTPARGAVKEAQAALVLRTRTYAVIESVIDFIHKCLLLGGSKRLISLVRELSPILLQWSGLPSSNAEDSFGLIIYPHLEADTGDAITRGGCKREELGQIMALSFANTDIDIRNTDIRSTDMDTDMNYASNTLRKLKNKLSFSNVDINVFNDQIQVCIFKCICICVYVYVNMHMYICLYDYMNT